MQDKLDFLWRTHSYINDYIRLADAKALGILAVFGALIGLLLDRMVDRNLSDGETALAASAIAVSALAMAAAGFVVFPRTWGHPTGMVYWKAIRSKTQSQFLSDHQNATTDGLLNILSKHTYEIAGVATNKYNALLFAFGLGAIGLVLSFSALAVV